MAGALSHGDLVAKIAINSRLTAAEVEEVLEVLATVIQAELQGGGTVDLLGVGTFLSENKDVKFQIGQSLSEIIKDPSIPITIDRSPTGLTATLYSGAIYKHKVNVGC